MKIMVLIEEVETGEMRWYDDGEEHQGTESMWSWGSYSCDCNRALFFARAAKMPDIDIDCSDGKYNVICILREDGVQLGANTDYHSILEAVGYFGYDSRNHAGRLI